MATALSLYQQLQDVGRVAPNAVALWRVSAGGSDATTYSTLAARAERFACALAADGAAGEVIPLFMAKGPDLIAAMVGAIGAGKAFAVLNRKLRGPQLATILSSIKSDVALTDASSISAIVSAADADAHVAKTRWRVVCEEGLLANAAAAIEKARSRVDLKPWDLFADKKSPLPQLLDSDTRPGCCLFTSGSTGSPKGVLIAETDLRKRAAAEVDCFELEPSDVLLNVLPFSFDVGLNQICSALYARCAVVISESWLPMDLLRTAAGFQVTGIAGVPAVWSDLLNARMTFDVANAHSSLRYITVSGGDLPLPRLRRLKELAPGVNIFKTYGQSETFRSTVLRPEHFDAKPASVGKPFGTARLYVCRSDGSKCNPGEPGEIVHSGLGAMLGYLGEHSDQANPLRANPFHSDADPAPLAVFTGDIGWTDEDGFLYIKGRHDAMLKIAGNRVYPQEVSEQLLKLAGVMEAEVVGVKCAQGDTDLFAFLVLATERTPMDLRRELGRLLPSYMVPRELIPIEAIPRTTSGKPDRPALIQRASQMQASRERSGATSPRD